MNYIEIKVSCDVPFRDILIAEMAELGFDSFVETEAGFDAYINESLFNHERLEQCFSRYRKQTEIGYEQKKIPRENWNEAWEKNYEPIRVSDRIYVRATFHKPRPDFEYEIIINPRMSFGTGHHETTQQLLAMQPEIDHRQKTVLDIGSGTGILAIMAAKLGAASVAATDIDDWCIENATENFKLNQVKPDWVRQGAIRTLNLTETYDIVLANINKNVLLDELEAYAALTKTGGYLFLSGFYARDETDLMEKAKPLGFKKLKSAEKRNWMALLLRKEC